MRKGINIPTGFFESLQSAENGVDLAWPAGVTAMKVEQVDYTQADLKTKFQGYVKVFGLPGKLARQHADAVKVRDEAYADAHDFLTKFFQALPAYVGSTEDGLAPYGKAPPKQRTQQTTAQKAETAVKRKATREARGTMGPKQKAKIHGTVPAEPLPPVTPPKTGG